MSTNLNIFERLAADKDFSEFSSLIESPPSMQSQNEFSKLTSVDSTGVKENIFQQLSNKSKERKEDKFGFLETLKDVGQQVAAKGASGVLGAYGNILDATGLQTDKITPQAEQRNSRDLAILNKIDNGEVPSYGEILLLTEDSDSPGFGRFPTSQDVQKGIKALTGVGEGKTSAGRIAGRGAEFLGEGIATGGGLKALGTLAASGTVGQSLREAGLPESVATGVEIGGSLIPSAIQGKVVPRNSEANALAEAGRKIGLTEKQIAPLVQGEQKTALLSKVARKGSKTKERFASIKESLGDSYQTIKNQVSTMGQVSSKDRTSLINNFTDIKNDLSKTLKASPDKEAAINFIQDAIDKVSKKGATPEELINFWQDINKSVKWNSIQGGKKSLTRLKEPILEVLTNVAPEAAKDFELTNQLYSKYSQIAKKLKPDLVDSFINKAEILAIPASGLALAQGNPWVLASLGTENALRLLGREMLINPYFQNLGNKLVKNFNQGSVKAVTDSVKQAHDYMKRKHPEEDWSFLIED